MSVRATTRQMATWRLVPVGFWKSFWLSVIVLFYWIVGVHLKNLPGIPSREDAADKEAHRTLRFLYENAYNFTQLFVDEERNQLIVGSRDYIFRLSMNNLSLSEVSHWPATPEAMHVCLDQGRSEEECRNYITALHIKRNDIFVCGTFASRVACRHYGRKNLKRFREASTVGYRLPRSMNYTSTSLLSTNGELFMSGRLGSNEHVSTLFRTGNLAPLITPPIIGPHFYEPHFVGTYEAGPYIYVFYREKAYERLDMQSFPPIDNPTYTRAVRICRDDPGYLNRPPYWTTFLKTRLMCVLPGEGNFYFDEIESVDYNPRSDTFYASFTSAKNQIIGSAICEYKRKDIDHALGGPTTGQSNKWKRGSSAPKRYQCHWRGSGNVPNNEPEYRFSTTNTQTYHPVREDTPLYSAPMERATFLQVDEVPRVDSQSKRGELISTTQKPPFKVMFLGTANGLIKKIVHDPERDVTCVLEKLEPFQVGEQMTQMKLSRPRNAIYASTNYGVVKVPLSACGLETTKEDCLATGDPYCGWDPEERKCIFYQNIVINSQWQQAMPCTGENERKTRPPDFLEREDGPVSEVEPDPEVKKEIDPLAEDWLMACVVIVVGYVCGLLTVALVYTCYRMCRCRRQKVELRTVPEIPMTHFNVKRTTASNGVICAPYVLFDTDV